MTITDSRADSGCPRRSRAARRAGPGCCGRRNAGCPRRQRITGEQESVVGGVGGRPRRGLGTGVFGDRAPRRAHVIVVTGDDPAPATWAAAIDVGAAHVLRLPAQEHDLVRELADAGETARDDDARGAVVGGDRRVRRRGRLTVRGGAGADRRRCTSGRRRSLGRRHRSAARRRNHPRRALARPGARRRTADLVRGARRAAATPWDRRAVGHPARPRIGRRAQCKRSRRRPTRRSDCGLRPPAPVDRCR